MIQLFRASELPPDVPGMIVTDGDTTVILLNPACLSTLGTLLMYRVANALLSVFDTEARVDAVTV